MEGKPAIEDMIVAEKAAPLELLDALSDKGWETHSQKQVGADHSILGTKIDDWHEADKDERSEMKELPNKGCDEVDCLSVKFKQVRISLNYCI